MSDLLEQQMRETLSERAAQIDPKAAGRIRAIDYHPRRHRVPALPAMGALSVSALAVAATVLVTLGSSAAPAFAGWSATPTPPASGQLAAAEQQCNANLGTPALTDTRGPYTVSIYAEETSSHLCLQGGSLSIASTDSGPAQADVAAGQVQLFGSGSENSSGQALTLVDGRIGSGVTSVTIERGDGGPVQATVSGGWYLAWWPGTAHATTADVTTASGTVTQQFPSTQHGPGAPVCPAGGHCSNGYSFGSGVGSSSGGGPTGTQQMTVSGSRSQ